MNLGKRLHILQANLLLIVCKNIMYKDKISSIVCFTVSDQMISSTVESPRVGAAAVMYSAAILSEVIKKISSFVSISTSKLFLFQDWFIFS